MEPFVIDNGLSNYGAIREFILSSEWRYGWTSSLTVKQPFFNKTFTDSSKNHDIDTSHHLPAILLDTWRELQLGLGWQKKTLTRCYANLQLFGSEGYSHTDAKLPGTYTVVIYICPDNWPVDWGGETVIFDSNSEIVKSVRPKANRVFIFPGELLHQARSVSKLCDAPRITLMFKARD